MSLKSVRTLTAAQLAKKWNLSLAEIRKLIEQGVKVEREHTKSEKESSEIARDHLGEKPDYYKRLKKIEEGISAGPERESDYSIGDPTGNSRRVAKVEEKKNLKRVSVKEQGSPANPVRYTERPLYETSVKKKVKYAVKAAGQQTRIAKELRPDEVESDKTYQKRKKGLNRVFKESQIDEFDTSALPMSSNIEDRRKGATPGGATPQNLEAPTTAKGIKDGSTTSSTTTPSNTGASGRSFPLDKQGKLDKVELRRQSEKDYESKTPSQMNEVKKTPKEDVVTSIYQTSHWKQRGPREYHVETKSGKTYTHKGPKPPKVGDKVRLEETKRTQGYQNWPGEKKKKFFSGPKDANGKTETQKWAEHRQKERESKKEKLDEISAELVGKVSNARFWRGEAPSKTLSRAINKKFIESGKKKEDDTPFEGSKKRSHEKSSTHVRRLAVNAMKQYTKEETTMDTKELINEALDNILENNLVDMKENFLAALQEKAMEKLEEKKKEISSNYFAQ